MTPIIVRRIAPNERYWSQVKFRDWCADRMGADVTLKQIADELGIGRSTVCDYLLGRHPPSLDQYLRMVAAADESLGVWLDHVAVRQLGRGPCEGEGYDGGLAPRSGVPRGGTSE